MNLRALYDFVFRYQWLLLGSLVAGLLAAAAVYHWSPPRYRSEAKLLVRYVTDTLTIDPEITGKRMEEPGGRGEMVITTEQEILTSPSLMASAVAAQAELEGAAAPESAATPKRRIEDFASHYEVRTAKDSSTIQLSYDGKSPELAQQAMRCLIAAYLLKHQEVHQDPGAFAFISQQTGELQVQLDETEAKLRLLKQGLGVASLAEAQTANVLRERDLARLVSHAESTLAATRARLKTLEGAMGLAVSAGGATPLLPPGLPAAPAAKPSDVYGQLQRLRETETGLLATYTTNSIPVQGIRARMLDLQAQLAREPMGSNLPALLSAMAVAGRPSTDDPAAHSLALQADIAALTAELSVLRDQQKAARLDGRQLEMSEAPIARLERARDIYETNYRYFSQRLEKERINVALDASNISNIVLIQSPTLPVKPRYNDVLRHLLLVLALFVGTGAAAALAREQVLDHAFRHADEVPRLLGMPLLVTLPALPRPPDAVSPSTTKARADRRDRQPRWLSGCEVLAQLIRRWAQEVDGPLLVGFTAPNGGAGVSTIARQVALALQQSDMPRVILATVLSSGKLVYPSAAAEPVQAMAGPAEAPDGPPNNTGPWLPTMPPEPSQALTTHAAMTQLAQRECDCVLLDMPPPEEARASVRLLPNLHGVIVVLDHGRTTRAQALACVGVLRQLRCRILGGAVNRFTSPIPNWLWPATSSPSPPPPPARNTAEHTRNAMGDALSPADIFAVRGN